MPYAPVLEKPSPLNDTKMCEYFYATRFSFDRFHLYIQARLRFPYEKLSKACGEIFTPTWGLLHHQSPALSPAKQMLPNAGLRCSLRSLPPPFSVNFHLPAQSNKRRRLTIFGLPPAPHSNDQCHKVGHDRAHKAEQTKHFRYFFRSAPSKHREHRFRPLFDIGDIHQEKAC